MLYGFMGGKRLDTDAELARFGTTARVVATTTAADQTARLGLTFFLLATIRNGTTALP